MPTALVTASVATIAHWIRASRQVLADAPQLESQLSRLLIYGAGSKLENELLNGVGGSGKIKGLLGFAGTATVSATSATDKVGEVITSLQAAGYAPNAVVMNPGDWFAIASAKASTAGTYLLGSPAGRPSPNLWGTAVIPSSRIAAGTVLVGDFGQAAILDREAATVSIGTTGNDFVQNMLVLLAELRAGLAVFDARAFKKLSIS